MNEKNAKERTLYFITKATIDEHKKCKTDVSISSSFASSGFSSNAASTRIILQGVQIPIILAKTL